MNRRLARSLLALNARTVAGQRKPALEEVTVETNVKVDDKVVASVEVPASAADAVVPAVVEAVKNAHEGGEAAAEIASDAAGDAAAAAVLDGADAIADPVAAVDTTITPGVADSEIVPTDEVAATIADVAPVAETPADTLDTPVVDTIEPPLDVTAPAETVVAETPTSEVAADAVTDAAKAEGAASVAADAALDAAAGVAAATGEAPPEAVEAVHAAGDAAEAAAEAKDAVVDAAPEAAAAADVTDAVADDVTDVADAAGDAAADAVLAGADDSTVEAAADAAADAVATASDDPVEAAAETPTVADTPEAVVETAAAADVTEALPAAAEGVEAATGEAPKVEVEVKPDGEATVQVEVPVEALAAAVAAAQKQNDESPATLNEGAVDKAADAAEDAVDEALEDQLAVATEDLAVIETTGEEVVEAVAQADVPVEVAEEVGEEIDQVEEAIETLERYKDLLATAAENGGADSTTAEAVVIGLEHIRDQLNLSEFYGMPAMESFEIPGKRVSPTYIAMEEITGKLKEARDLIMDGLKKAWEMLVEFLDRTFSATGRMKAQAEALLKSAASLDGADLANENKTIYWKANSLKFSLRLGNQVVRDVAGEQAKVTAFVEEVVGPQAVLSLNAVKDAIGFAGRSRIEWEAEKKSEQLATVIQAIAGRGMKNSGPVSDIPAAPEGTQLVVSPTFMGNQTIYAYVPQNAKTINRFRTGVVETGGDNSYIGRVQSLPTLSRQQIEAIAKEALKFVAAAEEAKKVVAAGKDLNAVSIRVLSGWGTLADDNGLLAVLKDQMVAARHMTKGFHQPALQVGMSVHGSALQYAARSVAQYTKTTAKAAAPVAV